MKKNQSQVQGKETTLGERPIRIYIYEALNRLIHATGKAKNASYDMAMTFGRMSEPLTKVQKVDSTTTAKSYNFAYKYEDSNHPTAPTQIGHDHYTYDANGNPTLVTNDSANTTREMYWDEDNRLMVLSDNGKTSRYTYNAAGERIMKSYGTMEGVYINGAPQGITFHETDNFTLYPASILSVNKNRFTKHYFIGDKRIASRIGTGLFNNVYGRNGSYVTAGQQDYAERMNQIQTQKEAYYKQQGIAPGVPTMKGAYGDPENTKRGYNSIIDTLGNHDVPQGWIQTPRPNTTPNTNPGPPVSWNDPSNTDDPQAGYGYIPNDTTKEETFFYHNDHLGSTSYITDDHANITQYDAYLPYGELLVDEHSSSEELPYKFNGKQFDDETGLYYYGARYMNPVTSLWYGVDPLAEKYVTTSGFVYTLNNPVKFIDVDGREWTQTTDKNGNTVITVSLNLSFNGDFSAAQMENYKTTISSEFNRMISDASDGRMSGVIKFYTNNKDIVQSLVLTSDESSIIAGSTTYMSSQVNVNDKNGALKDYAIVAADVSHELLHTLRLAHPFERTQTADTKLLRVGPNSYISTPSTASNIGNNVMNYPMITIDGKTSTSQNSLTKGQLNLMLKEIELQKQGYGIYKYNNKLTNSQNEELYSKYFTNYWDQEQWPGYPVQKK